jgi:hypothetical protein
MVDVKTETKINHENETKAVNPRTAIREARQRRLKLIAGDRPTTVKVFAVNETMRGVLRHSNGTRFREALDEGVEWPNDSFTARRIADGSVRTDGPGSGEEAEVDETLNPRQQSAARKAEQKVEEHKEEPSKNGKSKPQQQPQHQPQPPAA